MEISPNESNLSIHEILRAGWRDSLPVIKRDNDNGFRNRLVHSCRTFSQGFHPLCSPAGEVRLAARDEAARTNGNAESFCPDCV